MDYGKLLTRAWQIPWQHKFLIGLGIIAGLFSSPGGSSSSYTVNGNQGSGEFPGMAGANWSLGGFETAMIVFAIVAIAAIVLVIAIAFWVITTVARGGLVAGVAQVEEEEPTGFVVAWRAGWQRVWPLLGISLIPAIPLLLMVLLGLVAFVMTAGVAVFGGDFRSPAMGALGAGVIAVVVCSLCVVMLVTLVLTWLRTLAERACMLESLGVWASYRRVFDVLREHLGPAIILLLLQFGIGVILAILAIWPGMLLALCCLLWPLIIVIQGAVTTYFSTLWTLAWREWTGMSAGPAALVEGPTLPQTT